MALLMEATVTIQEKKKVSNIFQSTFPGKCCECMHQTTLVISLLFSINDTIIQNAKSCASCQENSKDREEKKDDTDSHTVQH